MSYEGAGIYRHYKGGYYRVLGIGATEVGDNRYVVYTSMNHERELHRADRGVDFVLRPLNTIDGPDAFNTKAGTHRDGHGLFTKHAERFVKVRCVD